MRLIATLDLQLKEFDDGHTPPYAILSHRWRDGEVSFADVLSSHHQHKPGFEKIKASCQLARSAGFDYMWIDTCCIDKSSSAELSEAINSMYLWYKEAQVCYAYLDDIVTEHDLQNSEWFTRGWTLQELIAPKEVHFLNKVWLEIGTKQSLASQLQAITGIDQGVLEGSDPASCCIAQRMSWAAERKTTRIEDEAYSLMGLFDVNMPILYGERSKAFIRLQEEIIRRSNDQSIIAWTSPHISVNGGLLAPSAACFKGCNEIIYPGPYPVYSEYQLQEYRMTNMGLSIELPLVPFSDAVDTCIALLNSYRESQGYMAIFLTYADLPENKVLHRTTFRGKDVLYTVHPYRNNWIPVRCSVPQNNLIHYGQYPRKLHGFKLEIQNHHVLHPSPFADCSDGKTILMPKEGKEASGEVVMVKFLDANDKIAAVKIGFNSDFLPVCMIYDRQQGAVEELSSVGSVTNSSLWIDNNRTVDLHAGAVKVGEGYYAVRYPGKWFVGLPVEFGVGFNRFKETGGSPVAPGAKKPHLKLVLGQLTFVLELKYGLTERKEILWELWIGNYFGSDEGKIYELNEGRSSDRDWNFAPGPYPGAPQQGEKWRQLQVMEW